MKNLKTIFATMILCLGIAAAFTSCSDDDDDNPAIPAAKSIVGTYNGDMTCSVMGSESVFEAVTVSVAATNDATVTVAVSSFGNPPMQIPEIKIPGIKVSGSNEKYSLAATEFSGTTAEGKTYSGTLQGNLDNNIFTVRINLQYGAMPMPIICTFSSNKK